LSRIDNGTITTSELKVTAKVPGITADKFKECAEDAKANCPVSKALGAITITLEANLA
jgi:osmotically inducible protein OsmC